MIHVLECKKCGMVWPHNCEQAISIEWHGECETCKFTPRGSNNGTQEQLEAVVKESLRRQNNG